MLENEIKRLVADGPSADREAVRDAFARLREALSSGAVRAAEPDPSSPIGWRVNTWVKQGILLGFRFGETVDASMDHGRWPFYDKDTLPLKLLSSVPGYASSPAAVGARRGAHRARVICMPPMFVNIGAWIGEQSLIDSHALVGSCARSAARVHVSAGAQIGGVIEPVGALPVIVEDDALVGGNTGIYEGAIIRTRAVVGAGTVLTGSTPADLVRGEIIKPTADRPLIIPEGAVVVPGAQRRRRQGTRVGSVAGDSRHRQIPRLADRHAYGARGVDPVALTRALVDIDSTTGRETEAGTWLADHLRGRGFSVVEQVDGTRFNVLATVGSPSVVFSTHFDCVPRFSRAAWMAIVFTAAARATPKAFLPRRSPRPRRSAAREKRASGCCLWSARNEAATARGSRTRRRAGAGSWSTASRPTAAWGSRRAACCGSSSAPPDAPRIHHFRSWECRRSTRSSMRSSICDRSSCRPTRCSAAPITRSGSSPAAWRQMSFRRRRRPK
jgi:2,3,4,5-tetrahydropyridine-2-carboxylate N-succinyltransferase